MDRFLDAELMAREKKPDQGYFPLDDSLIRDGWPNMRSTYPQTTFAPSLQGLSITDEYWCGRQKMFINDGNELHTLRRAWQVSVWLSSFQAPFTSVWLSTFLFVPK